ncbi:hypothetical protein [Micrococcus luteus]|uniref:hypothetical protein n=1 Tax=Micrococcus luteus TaxID=1270 RepID=UPI002303674C|nr:hypothetical protein [Micrococcus luteus]
MSTMFYYTATQMMIQAGRKSPNAAHQLLQYMPAPDALIVAPRPTSGWTLASWRAVARTRTQPLRDDLLATIERLELEERELEEKWVGLESYKSPARMAEVG